MFKSLWDKIKSQWAVSVLLGLMVLVAILGIVLVAWPDGLIKQALWQPILVLLGLLALAIILVILWKVPQLQTPSELTEPAARANFENEAHRTTAQIVLGVVVLAGVYFTWQQVIAAQQTVLVSQEQQITERFTRAVEQLGNKDSITIRLGGIYALERIARDSPDKDHWQVMEVLTAYVRENARRVEPSEGDFASEKGDEVERRVPTDIQAILTVLDRRDSTHERPEQRLDLQDTDLPGVDLSGANLAGANLFGTNLEEANLLGADLTKAYLESANLSGASLIGAYLTRANLWGANLEVASL